MANKRSKALQEGVYKYFEFNTMLEQAMRSRAFGRGRRGFRGDSFRGQGRLLSVLKQEGPVLQKDLADTLGMRPQSVAELLAKLEKKGFVNRYPSESNKRALYVELTAEGAELVRDPDEFKPLVLDVLDDEELAQFNALFDKLLAGMREKIEEG